MPDTAQFTTTPPVSDQPTVITAPSPVPVSPVGSFHKEMGPLPQPAESTPLVELHESEPLPPEVEGYLQKLEAAGEIKLPEPITHDGNVLLASSEAQVVKEKIVLPLSQSGIQTGLSSKVTNSARWLAEWCVRLIKMMRDGVKYAPETDHG